MKVTKLEIRRAESYQTNPGQIAGLVTVHCDSGEQTIVLTATMINQIFALLANEVGLRAKVNAEKVTAGILESGQEVLLASTDGLLELPGSAAESPAITTNAPVATEK